MPRGAPKGRLCTICQHPQRPNIDLAIATGISRRLIAARFKVSADAAWRYGRAHLTSEIRAAPATKVLAREAICAGFCSRKGLALSAAPEESASGSPSPGSDRWHRRSEPLIIEFIGKPEAARRECQCVA